MTQSKNTTHTHYRQLQLDERGQIEAFHMQGMFIRQIAQCIHRSPSTISRVYSTHNPKKLLKFTIVEKKLIY
nr:helix-turn-helix domain-containing protein [Liquorilactobacillus aquaticus]